MTAANATIKDAIRIWAAYQESKKHPAHSSVYNENLAIWAHTLRSAPTNMHSLELEIGRKKHKRDKELLADRKWKIDGEVEALEWVKGRLICQDFEIWTELPKSQIDASHHKYMRL
ncbi:MAG TPA: hypothetical protein VJP79_01425 [Nitrososphaera sp.]|nr:hypothetical protein [Nitrososphaera sp.]